MARKVILGLGVAVSAEKAAELAARVAAHLGLCPADVLALSGVSVAVVEVEAAAPVLTPLAAPPVPQQKSATEILKTGTGAVPTSKD